MFSKEFSKESFKHFFIGQNSRQDVEGKNFNVNDMSTNLKLGKRENCKIGEFTLSCIDIIYNSIPDSAINMCASTKLYNFIKI